jgi:hypothetical protein
VSHSLANHFKQGRSGAINGLPLPLTIADLLIDAQNSVNSVYGMKNYTLASHQ